MSLQAELAPERPRTTVEAVRIEGLEKTYDGDPPIRAVDGIDLDVHQGEIFGLLGPNGAGKTTTVGMCTTRIRPTGGRVTIEGLDVVAEPARAKRNIGVVTQYNTLDRSLNLRDNLYYHCLFFRMGGRVANRRADELLEQFKLSNRAKAMPNEISGGMAQRLQVARSIAHHPSVLFLDEPTAGLDPQSRLALWETVQELRGDGLTVVLTTHYMEEADQLCDRVAVIDHGRILVCDTPSELKRSISAGTVVELTLDGLDDAFLAQLRAMPDVVSVDRTLKGARILASSSEPLVVRLVEAAQGHGLRDLSVSPSSLETVFIHLTGRDLRE